MTQETVIGEWVWGADEHLITLRKDGEFAYYVRAQSSPDFKFLRFLDGTTTQLLIQQAQIKEQVEAVTAFMHELAVGHVALGNQVGQLVNHVFNLEKLMGLESPVNDQLGV